jgi:hypothetical protein
LTKTDGKPYDISLDKGIKWILKNDKELYIIMMATNDSIRRIYGGFWIRTAAFLIDLVIVFVLVLLIGVVFSIPSLPGIEETDFIKVLMMWLPLILWLIVPWLYCVLWESSKVKATPETSVFSNCRRQGRKAAWILARLGALLD